MTDCLFCGVIAKSEDLLLRTDEVAAFLDHHPVFPGHILIVPVEHVDTLADLPQELMVPMLTTAQRCIAALQDVVGAQGTFVATNNVISQSVPHLHLHVVPRVRGDGLRGFFWPRHPYRDDDHRRQMRDRLRQALQG
jgi:histidine triad (HIT) family protein